jgi:hypothetical protein
MNSKEYVLSLIRDRIRQIYAEPESVARDIGELDAVLFQLHWIYAKALDKMSSFVDCRWQVFEQLGEAAVKTLYRKDQHKLIHSKSDAVDIIAEWQRLDDMFGTFD